MILNAIIKVLAREEQAGNHLMPNLPLLKVIVNLTIIIRDIKAIMLSIIDHKLFVTIKLRNEHTSLHDRIAA